MRTFLPATLSAAAVGVMLALPAMADESAVKARQGLMRVYAHSLGVLGGMAKGEVEYNAEAAQVAADNLLAAASMNQSAMWPQGTDNGAMPDKTAALPAIWEKYPDIAEKGNALVEAATAMQASAGSLDGVRASIGAVGGSCGACHKAYRQSDN